MKGEVKAFGRGKNVPDVRDMAGSITFKAQDEADAVQLAALYRAWWITPDELLTEFRRKAIEDYCRENNVRLVHTKT